MNTRLIRFLLRVYPAKWRAEYGSEMEELLVHREGTATELWNVLWSALRERARQPLANFVILLLSGSMVAFIISLLSAERLWVALSAPAVILLREQGRRPSALIANTPFEQFKVVWLGIPLVTTAFVTYAWTLILVWNAARRRRRLDEKRCLFKFISYSGSLFLVSALASLIWWQNGLPEKFFEWMPEFRREPFVSVWQYFELFASSTLGVTLLIQVPIFLIFGFRFQAIRTSESSEE